MELYDILQENRKSATLTAYTVPTTYPVSAMETSFLDAPAGIYLLGYNMEINFNSQKDKPIQWKLTLNSIEGDVFSESVSAADAGNNKSRAYAREYTHTGGDIVLSITFQDTGNYGFLIDTGNISITRLG